MVGDVVGRPGREAAEQLLETRGAEGATTAHGGDIVVWTSGTGAYAGISFNGSGASVG